MEIKVTERVKSGYLWEVGPEEGRGKTTKVFKLCTYVTLSK